MRTSAAKLLPLLTVMASVACALPAWADVLPEPERPVEWNDHPAPTPALPPEKEEIAAGIVLLSVAALASVLGHRRRASSSRAMEHAR